MVVEVSVEGTEAAMEVAAQEGEADLMEAAGRVVTQEVVVVEVAVMEVAKMAEVKVEMEEGVKGGAGTEEAAELAAVAREEEREEGLMGEAATVMGGVATAVVKVAVERVEGV